MPELAVDPTATLLHHQSEWLTSGQSRHTVVDVSPATLLGATNGNRFASRTAWRWTVEHLGQHYPKAVTPCFVTGADAVQVLHGQNRLCSLPMRISWVRLVERHTHKQGRLREELQHSAVHARPELSTIRCSQRTIGTAN